MRKNINLDDINNALKGGMSLKDVAYCYNVNEDEVLTTAAFVGVYLDGYACKIAKIRREMGWN